MGNLSPTMWMMPNALVQLQARYNHCGVAASEKCLSAATFVRQARAELAPFVTRRACCSHLVASSPRCADQRRCYRPREL
jgi:hypothetical protein